MTATNDTGVAPKARPTNLTGTPSAIPHGAVSARSRSLKRFYSNLQRHQLSHGLMRTDGGGIDTPYSDADLLRNFEKITFFDEYPTGGGRDSRYGIHQNVLRKWAGPVRFSVEFGPSVPPDVQAKYHATVVSFVARLARITGHPMSVTAENPNFFVLFVNEDERPLVMNRLYSIHPNFNATTAEVIQNLPKKVHCLAVSFGGQTFANTLQNTVVLIRTEQPELNQLACVHEELSQGLGLPNDSSQARPSIFNDDSEFALLTTHDEELLRLLYNPALSPGMSIEQARPILTRLIRQRHSGGT